MEKNGNGQGTIMDHQKLMLLLSEKRTALAMLRSGFAICAFSITIVSFLLAHEHGGTADALMLAFVFIGAVFLFSIGCYFLRRGFVRMKFHDKLIAGILQQNEELATLFYHK